MADTVLLAFSSDVGVDGNGSNESSVCGSSEEEDGEPDSRLFNRQFASQLSASLLGSKNGTCKAYIASADGKGKGVFSAALLEPGEVIMKYTGPLLTDDDIARIDHHYFIQIDDNAWLGASGDVDDFVNHSCAPNCALKHVSFAGRCEIQMIALCRILPGTELTFDYSTHMTNEKPIGPCSCKAITCRGTIDMYATLPPALQQYYENLGIVPGFAIRSKKRARRDVLH